MKLVYATIADVIRWNTNLTIPDNIDLYLRFASRLVRNTCECDLYDVDDNGDMTNADQIQAFRDATSAQVECWLLDGVDPTVGRAGQTPVLKASSIDGANLQFDAAAIMTAKLAAVEYLCDEALDQLHQHMLGTGQPLVW